MKNCDILINDCRILTPEYSIEKNYSIVIKDSNIIDIGPSKDIKLKYLSKDVISGKGKLAMPGFVDGHTHTSQQLLRGRITDEYPVIYLRFNLPYESKLNENDIELCTSLSCLEMIKSGITTFADAGSTDLHKVVEQVDKSGLRAALTRATSDKGDLLPPSMKDSTFDAIKKTEDLYKEFHGSGDGRINIWFQFRSVATCSEELIRGVAEKAREYNTGLHTHLSEYNETILYTLGKYGIREVEFLDRLGAVGPNLLAAHSILVNERDLEILKDRNAKIVHCPRSNLGKGFTKTPQMLGLGMSVGLGTDGTAHSGLSMFKEITAFRHSQIAQWGVPYFDSSVMPTKTLINLATLGGAKALQLDKQIGSLEIGKKADLIMINIDQPHIIPTHNLLNTLTETVETNDIVDVIVNGKVLMENRVVSSIDEEKLMFEAKSHYKKIIDINNWDDKLAVGEI